MQRIDVHYARNTRLWWASYTDAVGQLGDAQCAATRDQAVYRLGVEMGRNPERFSRPLAQILTDAE
jgi:hypothetical protein